MQLSRSQTLILNALLFQLGWFACIFGAQRPGLLLVAVACLTAHFLWVARWRVEGRLVASVALFGSALDTFLLNLGYSTFPATAVCCRPGSPCSGRCSPPR